MPLTLTLSRKVLNNVDDVAGRWQFEGGSVTEDNKHVANYASFKRVTFQGTDKDSQNTASVTTTLFFTSPFPLSSHPQSLLLRDCSRQSHPFPRSARLRSDRQSCPRNTTRTADCAARRRS